jgi:cytochrome c oxidase subunit 2
MMTYAFLNELLGIQPNASAHGWEIDLMLETAHWFMLLLFIGWATFFTVILLKFNRKANPKASYYGFQSHASTHLEFGVVFIEAVLLLGFAWPLWAKRVNDFPTPETTMTVRVVAEQFGWNFHYAGPDGKFGKVSPALIDANNLIGLDRNDPDGKDDVVTRTKLTVPANHPLVLRLTSKDVIHNAAMPNMRMAQDTIPGMEVPVWFTPVREGEFEIICGQLCGAGHFSMKGLVEVVNEKDFAKWMDGKQQALKPAAPAPAPEGQATPEAPAKPAAS